MRDLEGELELKQSSDSLTISLCVTWEDQGCLNFNYGASVPESPKCLGEKTKPFLDKVTRTLIAATNMVIFQMQ